MEYSREKEVYENNFRPSYYIYYEHEVWPDNCRGSYMEDEEDCFDSIDSLLKWIIRMEEDEDVFKIHYIKKLNDLTDSDIQELNDKYKIELEEHKKRKEEAQKIRKEREKKRKQIEAEKKEKEQYEIYLSLKEKFKNV